MGKPPETFLRFIHAASAGLSLQSPTQQHYSSYDEAHLKPILQHIAKNVLMVTEGKSKFMVSLMQFLWLSGRMKLKGCSSTGCEEQILEQQAAEDQPHPSAEEHRAQKHGSSSDQPIRLPSFSTCTFFGDLHLWTLFFSPPFFK